MGERQRYTATGKLRLQITELGGAPVQYRGERLPSWFEVQLSHPDWPTEHAVAPEMAIEISVSVSPQTGPVLAGIRSQRGSTATYADALELLKATVDIDRVLQETAAEAVATLTLHRVRNSLMVDPDGAIRASEFDPDTLRQVRDNVFTRARAVTAPSRRRIVTPALLNEVAQVYRKAHAAGQPPTIAVSEHFVTSHRNAARWVGEARKVGILGPAHGPRPGEAGDEVAPDVTPSE